MRLSGSALTQQAVSTPRGPVPNERRRRRPPHGRRTGTTGEWPPATRGSPPAPAEETDPDAGRLLRVVFEAVVPVGCSNPTWNTASPATSAGRRRTPGGPRCVRGCGRQCDGRPPPAPPRTPPRMAAAGCRTRARTAWPSAEARPGPRRHGDAGEIGRLPELDLGGRHVDPQIRTQPVLHPSTSSPPTWSMCRWVSTTSVTDAGSMPAPPVAGPTARPAASPGTPPLSRRR